jgi:hypothetical protein
MLLGWRSKECIQEDRKGDGWDNIRPDCNGDSLWRWKVGGTQLGSCLMEGFVEL